jgi:hypothetical protein
VLDETPGVEKTSLFGTAVHAVLRGADVPVRDLETRLRAAGIGVDAVTPVTPSLEDVFLDVVDRATAHA